MIRLIYINLTESQAFRAKRNQLHLTCWQHLYLYDDSPAAQYDKPKTKGSKVWQRRSRDM